MILRKVLPITTELVAGWTIQPNGTIIKADGTPCSTKAVKDGYRCVQIQGTNYAQHRIAFFLYHGYVPNVVDHRDRDKANNRENNLRDGTDSLNQINTKQYLNNTAGCTGIHFRRSNNSWAAQISFRSKRYRRCFQLKEDAINQRLIWELQREVCKVII